MHNEDEIILGDPEYYSNLDHYGLSDEEDDSLTEDEKEMEKIGNKLCEYLSEGLSNENLEKTSIRLKPSTLRYYYTPASRSGHKPGTVMRLTLEAAAKIIENMNYNPFFDSAELTF